MIGKSFGLPASLPCNFCLMVLNLSFVYSIDIGESSAIYAEVRLRHVELIFVLPSLPNSRQQWAAENIQLLHPPNIYSLFTNCGFKSHTVSSISFGPQDLIAQHATLYSDLPNISLSQDLSAQADHLRPHHSWRSINNHHRIRPLSKPTTRAPPPNLAILPPRSTAPPSKWQMYLRGSESASISQPSPTSMLMADNDIQRYASDTLSSESRIASRDFKTLRYDIQL